jgi:6-pyruvoyltetrahydropterin/6-carboxytetrahydropterin synthase
MLKTRPVGDSAAPARTPTAVLVTRRATFAAAHVLARPEWEAARNQEVFGACAGDHGHNYVIEVGVLGVPDPQTGMVINLKELDRVLREAVVEHVDHRHLNRVAFLDGLVPTAENLARAFWDRLEERLGDRLQKVRLVESENNSVEVSR